MRSDEIPKEANATIHMMVRDEMPSVVFALMSVLPGAKKAIVVDTGSKDGTRKWLKKISDMHPNKVRLVFRNDVPDSTGWAFDKWNQPNKKLSDIRKWMIEETTTPYIWLVDGDEVYRDITVRQVVTLFEKWPKNMRVVYLPLLWFVRDINTLGNFSPASYGLTGRLFIKKGLTMRGTFPGEMHCGTEGEDLGPRAAWALKANWIEPFHHLEMVTKPFRRRILDMVPYNGPQPEVFERHAEKTQQIERSMNEGRQDAAQGSNKNSDDGASKDRVIRSTAGVPA